MARKHRSTKAHGKRYTDKQKSVAVATVRISGGRVTDQTLADVRLVLKSPTLSLSTLNEWVAAAPVVSEQSVSTFDPEADALTQWKQTKLAYLKRANSPQALALTDGKDAVAAAERAQKMEQLLQGLPTEIVELTSKFYLIAIKHDDDPRKIMEALINDYESEPIAMEKD